jgi:hypothetical protein
MVFGRELVGSSITPPVFCQEIVVLPMAIHSALLFRNVPSLFLQNTRVIDCDVNRVEMGEESYKKYEKHFASVLKGLNLEQYDLKNEPVVPADREVTKFKLSLDHINILRFGNVYGLLNVTDISNGSISYQWWLQLDGSADFSRENVIGGAGCASSEPSLEVSNDIGVRMDWNLGYPKIHACGFVFNWNYPGMISLPEVDVGIRIGVAESKWSEVGAVNCFSPELDWFYNKTITPSEWYSVSKTDGRALMIFENTNANGEAGEKKGYIPREGVRVPALVNPDF